MKLSRISRTMLALALAGALIFSACDSGGSSQTDSGAPASSQDSTAESATDSSPTSSTQEGGAENTGMFNELGTFPIVNEKQNIIVYLASSMPEFNPDTNWMTGYYEEKTNVSVTWNLSNIDQFKEKLNLAFAGGEKIDLVVAGGHNSTAYSMTDVLKMAEQGVVLPIEDLIENNSIYFKQRLGEVDGWKDILTTPDGHVYTLPTLNECYHCMYYGKMWVNQEWLKNVGLENPTTTEEFKDMLIAFRDQDANGNGNPNDEIPMMGAIDSYGAKIDTFLMSAFIYDDGENRLYLDNGTVTPAFVQPEFQEGLRYLNDLFNEGLIYKESFTQTREVRNKLNSQNYESIAGAMPNIHHGIGNRETGEPARWIEYEPIAPLVGPDGLQITRYNYYDKFQVDKPAGFIPDTCENPELVIRWLDWFMSDEGTVMLLRGEEGLGWEQPDAGATGVDGSPATYKKIVLEPGDDYYNNLIWGQAFPNYNTAASRLGEQQPDDMLAEDGSGLEKFLYVKSKENYAPYAIAVDQLIPPMYYDTELVGEVAQLTTNINTYVEESIAKFIIGDMNVDTDWEKYLNELNNLGLPRYLEIIQQTYDSSSFSQ
ncbi:MAG: extracellular solute-binding protein [Oscillospiraceae bacterium]